MIAIGLPAFEDRIAQVNGIGAVLNSPLNQVVNDGKVNVSTSDEPFDPALIESELLFASHRVSFLIG